MHHVKLFDFNLLVYFKKNASNKTIVKATVTTTEFHVRLIAVEPSESAPHQSITLPNGSTDLGRGELTGVHEKALSRQQLTVTVDDETHELVLVRKGLNAAFYTRGGVGESKELEKDKMQVLENGDVFSLLANLYKYRVEKELVTKTIVSSAPPPPPVSTSTASTTSHKNPIDAIMASAPPPTTTTTKALPTWLTGGASTTSAPPPTTTTTSSTSTTVVTKPKKPKAAATGGGGGGGGTTSLVAKKKKGKKRKAGDDSDDEDEDGPNECNVID